MVAGVALQRRTARTPLRRLSVGSGEKVVHFGGKVGAWIVVTVRYGRLVSAGVRVLG